MKLFYQLLAIAFFMNLCVTAAHKPNILWIYLEDTSPYFSCYGDLHNNKQTPNVDQLAEEGILFERCFMPAPVCSSTRSALIIGAMQTTTGTHHHRSARGDKSLENTYSLPPQYKTLPEQMRAAGYFTFNKGKDDYNFTYDRNKLYSSGTSTQYKYPENGWQGLRGTGSWRDRKDKSQPWFGQIQMKGGKSRLTLKKDQLLKAGEVPLPPYFPDTKIFNSAWTHHWNTVRQTDADVKKIIDGLKKDGEYENTIIFLFSDHGDNKSLRHKQFCYEGGVHVPLIIVGKHELIQSGTRRTAIMSGLDISATTLSLAGVKLPTYLEGQDLFSKTYEKKSYIISARDRCDFTIDRIRTVRSDNFRYIRNYLRDRVLLQSQYRDNHPTLKELRDLHSSGKLDPKIDKLFFGERPSEELYDLRNDPHQMRNLVLFDGYKTILLEHRKVLKEWVSKTDDKAQYPESAEELKAQIKQWKGKCVNPEYKAYK